MTNEEIVLKREAEKDAHFYEVMATCDDSKGFITPAVAADALQVPILSVRKAFDVSPFNPIGFLDRGSRMTERHCRIIYAMFTRWYRNEGRILL